MKITGNITPGNRVWVQPLRPYEYFAEDGSVKTGQFQAFGATVLVDSGKGQIICTGNNRQAAFADWVQDACKEAGISPDQRIRLALRHEVASVGVPECTDAALRKLAASQAVCNVPYSFERISRGDLPAAVREIMADIQPDKPLPSGGSYGFTINQLPED